MSDQTPRVPDLRWHENEGLFTVTSNGAWKVCDNEVWPLAIPYPWPELPSDAVKLGDVEALKRQILEALDRKWTTTQAFEDHMADQLDLIRAIVEGENR